MLETLVALVIIIVVLVPASIGLISSDMLSLSSLNTTESVFLAQGILENLKVVDYDYISTTDWNKINYAPTSRDYFYRLLVEEDKNFSEKKVTVEVRYLESDDNKQIAIIMLKSKR